MVMSPNGTRTDGSVLYLALVGSGPLPSQVPYPLSSLRRQGLLGVYGNRWMDPENLYFCDLASPRTKPLILTTSYGRSAAVGAFRAELSTLTSLSDVVEIPLDSRTTPLQCRHDRAALSCIASPVPLILIIRERSRLAPSMYNLDSTQA